MADEYISREAALKYIKSEQCRTCSDIGLCGNCAVLVAVKLLEKVPAADVVPVVHGKWLLDRWPSWPHRECSRCKIMFPRTKEVPDQYWQYCPNCIAQMDGGNEGE